MQARSPETFLNVLKSKDFPVEAKYKAIFELKSLENQDYLIESFAYLNDSELLKHEVAYALGQMKPNQKTIEFLKNIINDVNEQPVVRHEAGEGLSNYGDEQSVEIFEKYKDSEIPELRDTCRIALEKTTTYKQLKENYAAKYSKTIEPAAPLTLDEISKETEKYEGLNTYEKMLAYILDDSVSLFKKYRTMYFLRNENSANSVKILCKLLEKEYREKTGTLLRHEVCFIFGQIEPKAALDVLEQTIADETENEIVRHEAISAYSSISVEKNFISKYCTDPSPIVRESALVAVNMIDYWQN